MKTGQQKAAIWLWIEWKETAGNGMAEETQPALLSPWCIVYLYNWHGWSNGLWWVKIDASLYCRSWWKWSGKSLVFLAWVASVASEPPLSSCPGTLLFPRSNEVVGRYSLYSAWGQLVKGFCWWGRQSSNNANKSDFPLNWK